MKRSNNMTSSSMLNESAVRADHLSLFLERSLSSMYVAVPLASVVAILFWEHASHTMLISWLVLVYTALAASALSARKWVDEIKDAERCEEIRRSLLLLWGLSGLIWAAGPVLFMPHDLAYQIVILSVLALGSIATVTVIGIYFPIFLLFAMPLLGSQFAWFLWQDDDLHFMAAAVILMTTVALTYSARGVQANALKNLELQRQNNELNANLSSFKDALEHATEAIAFFSRKGSLEYANPALSQLSGYDRKELAGKSWRDLYPDIDQALDFFKSEMSMIGRPWQGKLQLQRKEGGGITTMSSFSPVRDGQSGEISQCVVIQRDVEQEERMRERMEKLQRTESLSVMAGGIAHDFNNLLTSIMGSAFLISMSERADEESKAHCGRINEACQQAADLCSQMLAYSGQGRHQVKPVSLTELLQGMRGGLDANMHTRSDGQGKIVFDLGNELPNADVDEGQIRQIVANLVVNASEAISGRESGTVTIRTRPVRLGQDELNQLFTSDTTEEGDFVCLEVSDNGEGMERSTLNKVFDPFFTTRFMGRGLGLPAVMGVVFGHAGALNIESRLGEGTVVQAFFPCSDIQDSFETTLSDYTKSMIGWSGMGTVLIVDDDSALLAVASSMLERIGFQALCASSGEEAISLYQQNLERINLVLLDWSMPEMDGEAVAFALHQINPDVKVLLSSGYSEEMVMDNFDVGHIAGFVQKPYSFEQLKLKTRESLAV